MTPPRPPATAAPGDGVSFQPFRPPHDEDCPVCYPNRGTGFWWIVGILLLAVAFAFLVKWLAS